MKVVSLQLKILYNTKNKKATCEIEKNNKNDKNVTT